MATKKLNKSQIAELVVTEVTHLINTNRGLFKKDKDFEFESKISRLIYDLIGPKTGGGTSAKVNEAGEVFCNYFKEYLPAEEFNTKLSKPNKETGERHEVYKANCKIAEQILRKLRVLRYSVEKQATSNFRDKTIDVEEFNSILDRLEDVTNTKYTSPEQVPTVADVIGLTDTIAAL